MKAKVMGTVLVCVMILVSGLVGCGGISTIDGMTGGEILEAALTADAGVDTCQFFSAVNMDMAGLQVSVNMYGASDEKSKEMYTVFEDLTVQVYIVDNWVYGYDETLDPDWAKTELTNELWGKYEILPEKERNLLKEISEVKILGTEAVNGIDCYKLEVIPDLQAFLDWYSEESGTGGVEIDISELIKDFSVTVWIAKDMFYTVQQTNYVSMTYMGQTATMTFTASIYDFNKPVSVVLSFEARNAEELDNYEWEDWFGSY